MFSLLSCPNVCICGSCIYSVSLFTLISLMLITLLEVISLSLSVILDADITTDNQQHCVSVFRVTVLYFFNQKIFI